MTLFKRKEKSETRVTPSQIEETIIDVTKEIASLENQLHELDDTLYGVALFFECVNFLYADQPAVVETYRKQLRNIIQTGKEISQNASEILASVKKNSRDRNQLKQIKLDLIEQMPDAESVIKRARILVKLYENIFPNRPRSQAFTEDEIFQLMESAGEKFDEL